MRASRESTNKPLDVFESVVKYFYILTISGSSWRMCAVQSFPCVFLHILPCELLASAVYPCVNRASTNPLLQGNFNILRGTNLSYSYSCGEKSFYLNPNPNTLKFICSLSRKTRYFCSEIPCTLWGLTACLVLGAIEERALRET